MSGYIAALGDDDEVACIDADKFFLSGVAKVRPEMRHAALGQEIALGQADSPDLTPEGCHRSFSS